MKKAYLKIDPWKIIEKDFDPSKVKASESIFSLGNGAMGQRANFEEQYSGDTFQGSYIGGVYYPDKTRVGWWKARSLRVRQAVQRPASAKSQLIDFMPPSTFGG